MKKKVLIACDLEGVNNVVGEPYVGLGKDTEQWRIAKDQAALEINAAAKAFFALGAERVALWDNHGGGNNIDKAALDKRIDLIVCEPGKPRMYFVTDYDFVCYIGYHAMEGTLGGVLAHTMNSKNNQYYKLNGKYIGEVDMDAYIAASYGVPSCLFIGGDIACAQASRAVPGIVTVITKKELSRNDAIFRNNEELFADIKSAVETIKEDMPLYPLTYPSRFEKSFKRVEDAAKYYKKLQSIGIVSEYLDDEILGKDAHTVVSTVNDIFEFIKCI